MSKLSVVNVLRKWEKRLISYQHLRIIDRKEFAFFNLQSVIFLTI